MVNQVKFCFGIDKVLFCLEVLYVQEERYERHMIMRLALAASECYLLLCQGKYLDSLENNKIRQPQIEDGNWQLQFFIFWEKARGRQWLNLINLHILVRGEAESSLILVLILEIWHLPIVFFAWLLLMGREKEVVILLFP